MQEGPTSKNQIWYVQINMPYVSLLILIDSFYCFSVERGSPLFASSQSSSSLTSCNFFCRFFMLFVANAYTSNVMSMIRKWRIQHLWLLLSSSFWSANGTLSSSELNTSLISATFSSTFSTIGVTTLSINALPVGSVVRAAGPAGVVVGVVGAAGVVGSVWCRSRCRCYICTLCIVECNLVSSCCNRHILCQCICCITSNFYSFL